MTERIKRLNLAIPYAEYRELASAAKKRNTTVTELLRKFNRIGLDALKPNVSLIRREEGKEDTWVYVI